MKTAALLVLCLLCLASPSFAQAPVSCDQTSVQNAVSSAVAPATVKLAPGNCSWNWLFLPQGITLEGADGGATVITMPGAAALNMYMGPNRVTGVTFQCAQVSVAGGVDWRVDHNFFTCSSDGALARSIYVHGDLSPAQMPQGLIDHNAFFNTSLIVYGLPCTGGGWENCLNTQAPAGGLPTALGTNQAVYIEDNTFVFTYHMNAVDCQHLGAYVFRHNHLSGTYVEAHSARMDSRGCKKWEIYENDSVVGDFNPAFLALLRGGTGVVFNNRWAGAFNANAVTFDNVRSFDYLGNVPGQVDGAPHGMCWGSSPFDGNTDVNGYPCLDQIGRGQDITLQHYPSPPYATQASEPPYVWNNVLNGAVIPVFVQGAAVACPRCPLVIQPTRDYVANEGAKPGYEPYVYPHPLQASSIEQPLVPAAPQNLRGE